MQRTYLKSTSGAAVGKTRGVSDQQLAGAEKKEEEAAAAARLAWREKEKGSGKLFDEETNIRYLAFLLAHSHAIPYTWLL